MSAVLLREGHKVSVAENGSDALEILNKSARTDFDLVLSDIEMPKMNGLQLAQAVRKNDQWKNVPMIAITTKYNAVYVEEGKKAGFNAYLEKLNAEVLLGEDRPNLQGTMRLPGGTLHEYSKVSQQTIFHFLRRQPLVRN